MIDQVISAQGLTGCLEEDCDRPLQARGRCHKHYVAWYRRTPKEHRLPALNLKAKAPRERFELKTDRRGPNECWPWTGCRHRSGHGEFFVSRERGVAPAHTYAVELATGVRCPEGREGCHHCDNAWCVNPTHVYYGTRKDNVRDMLERGRARRGSAAAMSKITEDDVLAIRCRFAAGETQSMLATEFLVSAPQISYIVNGKAWAHVSGPIRTHGRPGRRPLRKVA